MTEKVCSYHTPKCSLRGHYRIGRFFGPFLLKIQKNVIMRGLWGQKSQRRIVLRNQPLCKSYNILSREKLQNKFSGHPPFRGHFVVYILYINIDTSLKGKKEQKRAKDEQIEGKRKTKWGQCDSLHHKTYILLEVK